MAPAIAVPHFSIEELNLSYGARSGHGYGNQRKGSSNKHSNGKSRSKKEPIPMMLSASMSDPLEVSPRAATQSNAEIERWSKLREDYVAKGKPLHERDPNQPYFVPFDERLMNYKRSLTLSRGFGESNEAFDERTGLKAFFQWDPNSQVNLPELLGNDRFAVSQVQNFISEGATADQALKKYIDSVEGNASELPPKLAAYAQERGMLDGWEYPQEP